jgi:hypothetical protein
MTLIHIEYEEMPTNCGFQGTYETGVASYKHLYFNSTRNVLLIWLLTVLAVVALYEAIKRLASLGINGRLRFPMALLFLLALFPHYYSWWSYLNYWNDDFYAQWHHQLYFSTTEVYLGFIIFSLLQLDILSYIANNIQARNIPCKLHDFKNYIVFDFNSTFL